MLSPSEWDESPYRGVFGTNIHGIDLEQSDFKRNLYSQDSIHESIFHVTQGRLVSFCQFEHSETNRDSNEVS